MHFVHLLLDQLEQKLGLQNRIGIEGLIEDVSGLLHIEDIAGASDRLESLIFGMGDYSASQHMRLDAIGSTGDYPPDIWHYPRYKLITTCHAYGLDPIDGPYADFKDLDTLQTEAKNAATLGMFGKWAIHPSQVEHLQRAFAPSRSRHPSAQTTSRFCSSPCQWPRRYCGGRSYGGCRQHASGAEPTGSSRALRAVTGASP